MKLFSNEIVFRGHPDKVCDQISAAILDECLRQDENSRCGIEVMGGKGKVFITGEVTTKAHFDAVAIARRVLRDIGYRDDYEIIDNIGKQSADIALGTNDKVGGAGDQGMMFGYACNDTEELLPKAMVILQKLAKRYDELVHSDKDFYPDGKAQITGIYDDDFNLVEIKDFTISYNNSEQDRERTDGILKDIATSLCDRYGLRIDRFLINPTGRFLIGGFEGDAGLTGRKIVVDSYQSFANVGGGCMNGKDPSKVDLSGAYIARVFAKELLTKENLKWCEIQLSYAIGLRARTH
ncbi:MAG: methionine adenosyltransferase domain-containing protein, partial [Erysipelotrichaceae bacterium]|nr:methionine adenosyltransferase domain-containing protein [Erysipelotrichaceae bacterium]